MLRITFLLYVLQKSEFNPKKRHQMPNNASKSTW
jgi:hypothetical protein